MDYIGVVSANEGHTLGCKVIVVVGVTNAVKEER